MGEAVDRSVGRAGDAYVNPSGRRWRTDHIAGDAMAFHRQLPDYAPTPLRSMPEVARRLGLGRVLIKDESNRMGLPAFKILGASYAIDRALSGGGDATYSGALSVAPSPPPPSALVTATDGNHGRAVARCGRQRDIPVHIYIPTGLHPDAIAALEAEQATVTEVAGTYDNAVAQATAFADETGALLVQDTAWPGYEEIPQWIVDGYATIFREVDAELATSGSPADAVFVPVGVGSLALAALLHYRAPGVSLDQRDGSGHSDGRGHSDGSGHSDGGKREAPALVSVEPTGSACVLASLRAGERISMTTEPTAMSGLNCGTPSAAAWPAMKAGLDGAVAVSDSACAAAVHELQAIGIDSGPCGGATLAGLEAMLGGPDSAQLRQVLGLPEASTVVLLCTESSVANPAFVGVTAAAADAPATGRLAKPAQAPAATSAGMSVETTAASDHPVTGPPVTGPPVSDPPVSDDDLVRLLCDLVEIDSANPDLDPSGAGERDVADYIEGWSRAHALDVQRVGPAERPSLIITTTRTSNDGPRLILCGHLDTVGHGTMDAPTTARIDGDRLYGRGTYDMKGGLAAALAAVARLNRPDHAGTVIVWAVADEEYLSAGMLEVLRSASLRLTSGTTGSLTGASSTGPNRTAADAAIVLEPTELDVAIAHRCFVWIQIDIHGKAAHGSRPHLGVDAIAAAGPILSGLPHLQQRLNGTPHPFLGPGLIHASLIDGGTEESTVPEHCRVVLERRTLPGETTADVVGEVETLAELAREATPQAQFSVTVTAEREPMHTDEAQPVVRAVCHARTEVLGTASTPTGASYWADSALLSAAGIPTVLLGSAGEGAHAQVEWVGLDSVRQTARIMQAAATELSRRWATSSTSSPTV